MANASDVSCQRADEAESGRGDVVLEFRSRDGASLAYRFGELPVPNEIVRVLGSRASDENATVDRLRTKWMEVKGPGALKPVLFPQSAVYTRHEGSELVGHEIWETKEIRITSGFQEDSFGWKALGLQPGTVVVRGVPPQRELLQWDGKTLRPWRADVVVESDPVQGPVRTLNRAMGGSIRWGVVLLNVGLGLVCVFWGLLWVKRRLKASPDSDGIGEK
ncbi:MAG: hypothetical protein GXP27_06430 [Planctomycetes bacterium]|nr:hypothetical protein [Planctomycetota bacterium]